MGEAADLNRELILYHRERTHNGVDISSALLEDSLEAASRKMGKGEGSALPTPLPGCSLEVTCPADMKGPKEGEFVSSRKKMRFGVKD